MTEKLKRLNPKAMIIILLVLAAVLIFWPQKDKESEAVAAGTFSESNYAEKLEDRLTSIIEEIDGVGKVRVMVTLETSALYEYATDTDRDIKDGSTKSSTNVVLSVKGSNTKEAVISGYTLPKVNGVAVVCSGRITPLIESKVIGIASCALGIPTSKIYVTN